MIILNIIGKTTDLLNTWILIIMSNNILSQFMVKFFYYVNMFSHSFISGFSKVFGLVRYDTTWLAVVQTLGKVSEASPDYIARLS